jgi:predicted Zn-dependent protease
MGRRTVVRALSLLALVVAGCALNPVTHRPELAVVSQSTELALGAEQAKAIQAGMGLVAEGPLTAYVRAVGDRLAASSPRRDVPYAFHVVDTPEPNAFAIPGHVYVTRGLLVLLNDEDELAGVLAHEVGHIAARHAVQRLSRALPAGILTGVVSGVTGLASPILGSLFEAGGSLATEALLAPYSRDQEREADRVGQEIAAHAGFDPAALARSLATLERVEALGDVAKKRPSFLDSHPSTPERARTTAAYASGLTRGTAAGIATTRDAFLDRLDGIVVGQGATQGVFEKTTFLHPDLGFHFRFPSEWKTDNAATAVAGAAPDGKTAMILTGDTEGTDPMAGVRAFEREIEQPIASRIDHPTINDLPAAHISASAESDGRRLAVELWWIALDGHIFRLTGIAPARTEAESRPRLKAIAETFGKLTAEERGRITERRLRLVAAKKAESLTALKLRTDTPWKPDLIAVVNGVEPGNALTAGQRMKVAKTEPYRAAFRP